MKMDGRRESGNVDDRRGQRSGGRFGSGGGGNIFGGGSGGGNGLNILSLIISLISLFRSGKNSGGSNKGGGGCGCLGIIVILVIGYFLLSSGGLGNILGGLVQGGGEGFNPAVILNSDGESDSDYTPTAEEEELAQFSKQIFAGTEDVWTKIFAQNGLTYECPRLVLFTDYVSSGCGNASSQTGPFYCSADQCVYIDLSFFRDMKKTIGADGDFAYAYVIAHEVGHHVQYLLGDLSKIHSQQQRVSEKESNQLSVRLELQADFYAGVWAYHDNKMFNSLEDGDIEEALNAAQKIGDDYLQKKARGYTVPESFNHGTSEQRSRWLKKGVQTGDLSLRDSFTPAYEKL